MGRNRILLTIAIIFMFSALIYALDETEIVKIAQVEYNKIVPMEYRNQYIDYEILHKPSGDMVVVFWQRKINGIPVYNDFFSIGINTITGTQIGSSILKYSINASDIDTSYNISKEQAACTALNAYPTGIILEEPHLVIHGRDLLWDMTLGIPYENGENGGSSLWLGLDSDTGETKFFDVSMGAYIQQVPTHFDPLVCPAGTDIDLYIAIGLIIAVIVVGIYLKKFPAKKVSK